MRGFATALGYLAHWHRDVSLVESMLKDNGFTIDDLRDGGDPTDVDAIRGLLEKDVA